MESQPLARCLSFALLLSALGGCAQRATTLLVSVQGRPGLGNPAVLVATFSQDDQSEERRFQLPEGTTLPKTFAIRAEGRAGVATIGVEARDPDDSVLGKGEATATIEDKKQVDVTVTLYPDDFTLNGAWAQDPSKQYTGEQIFGKLSARQVASNGQGSYVVTWTDRECTGPRGDGSCVIWYRLYVPPSAASDPDGHGAAAGQDVAGEFVEKAYAYDDPAAAMREDGSFALVWKRTNEAAKTYGVYGRLFAASGSVQEAGKEIEMSSASTAGNADVAALAGADKYVVVWREKAASGKWQVVARVIEGGQAAATTLLVAEVDPTVVCGDPPAATCDGMQLIPTVAAGASSGFMVAWKEGTRLKGRIYTDDKTAAGDPFDLTSSMNVEDLDVAPLASAGYVAIWSDGQSSECKPDIYGRCIRMRRFLPAGTNGFKPEESAYTLNTSTQGDQEEPAIALGPAGNLLAVWTDRYEQEDVPGNIRGRRILAMGLPVGDDFQINTTLPRAQEAPSVACYDCTDGGADNGFVAVFRDGSGSGADKDGGIRSRLLFPDYDPTDGKLGAVCSTALPCGEELKCFPGRGRERCVPAGCDTSPSRKHETCPPGGECNTLSAEGVMCDYSMRAP